MKMLIIKRFPSYKYSGVAGETSACPVRAGAFIGKRPFQVSQLARTVLRRTHLEDLKSLIRMQRISLEMLCAAFLSRSVYLKRSRIRYADKGLSPQPYKQNLHS